MKINDLNNKSIIVVGLGKEGLANLNFLSKHFPGKKVAIADRLPVDKISDDVKKIIQNGFIDKIYLGPNYLDQIDQFDVILKSPGVDARQPQLAQFNQKEGKIMTSGTEIFMSNCQGSIVGITGTKGKSTTTSVIYEVLKEGGLNTYLIGNIGIPALNFLDKDSKNTIFVFEFSSHQLQPLRQSPYIAVLTNFYPEHLDYYKDLEEYKQAKINITRFQAKKDFLIYNQGEKILEEIAHHTKAQQLPFSLNQLSGSVVFKHYDKLVYHSEEIINTKDVPLIGDFNLQNVMPAIITGKIFNIPTEKIRKGIKNFKPLPHRLEFVGKYQGISFYDDSISTIPQTVAAAIEALGDDVETLIAGGYDRGIDFSPLGQAMDRSKIKNLILFPTTGAQIWNCVCKNTDQNRRPKKFDINSMEEAVKIAYKVTSPEKICLLSPASTSFNLFKNFEDRGNQFKEYVIKLASQGVPLRG